MKLTLLIRDIADRYVRENFQAIDRHLRGQKILSPNWEFVKINVTVAVTNFKIKHGLGAVPKDVLQTSLVGAGSLTWNYNLFTTEYLDVTTTGACTARAFIGSHEDGA